MNNLRLQFKYVVAHVFYFSVGYNGLLLQNFQKFHSTVIALGIFAFIQWKQQLEDVKKQINWVQLTLTDKLQT